MKGKTDRAIILIKFVVMTFIIGTSLMFLYQYFAYRDYATLTTESSFNGKIKTAIIDRGVIRIVLEEGKQKIVLPYSRNYEYEIYDLRDLIKKGDSIIKRRNSDTIAIKRNEEEFFFVMNKTIGNKNLK